ncbi:MAG: RpiB/LacA/LacB family sugar-phosphate isomerase, partial [Flavobacteriales bacterium]
AAIAWTPEIANLARTHNNANVICIPARFVSESEAVQIVDAFMAAKFEGGRHARRVGKIACCVFATLLGIGSAVAQNTETKEGVLSVKYAEMLDTNNLKGHLSII